MNILLAAMMPLWSNIWQTEPLDNQNTAAPYVESYLSIEDMNKYSSKLTTVGDPRIQSLMVIDVSKMNNTKVIPLLYTLLKNTKSAALQTEILSAIYNLRSKDNKPDTALLVPFLTSPNHLQRAYAVARLATATDNLSEIMTMLLSENSEFVISQTVQELLTVADKYNFGELNAHFNKNKININPYLVKLLAAGKLNPDDSQNLISIAKGKNELLKTMIAEGLRDRVKGGVKLHNLLSQSKDARTRYISAQASQNPQFSKNLLKLTKNQPVHIISAALLSLGNKNDAEVEPVLLNMLGDKNKSVRESAAAAIIQRGQSNTKLAQRLKALLMDNNKHDAALRVISELKITGLNKQIITAAMKATSEVSKIRSIAIISQQKIVDATPALIKYSKDKNISVRKKTAVALGNFSNPQVISSVMQLLGDTDSLVITAATESAGRIKHKSFSKKLMSILSNYTISADTRAAACWAVARCGVADKKIMTQLKALCIKKVISMEGEKMFDDLTVRLSAYYATVDLAKINNDNKKYLADLEKSLRFASDKEFKTLLKDAKAYKDCKKTKQIEVERPSPRLTIKSR